MARFNERGEEIPDPTPVAIPAGWQRPETLQDLIRRYVDQRQALADADQLETEEEANDFDCEDEEPDPLSQYEMFDAVPEPVEARVDDQATQVATPPEKPPVGAVDASKPPGQG